MTVRGVRGATVATANNAQAILLATHELLEALIAENPSMQVEDIGSVFFSVTEDLTAAYPALAAREMGWVSVPLLCAQEIPVPDGLAKCIRVLIHWNTNIPQSDINHVYLREAEILRPDLNLAKTIQASS